MAELRENEQKTLLALQELNRRATVAQIMETSGLAHAAVMRAALTLAEGKLIAVHERKQTIMTLNQEGKLYAEKKLPERRTLDLTHRRGGEIRISDVQQEVDIPADTIPVALAWLARKHWATIDREKGTIAVAQEEKPPLGDDERLLKFLAKRGSAIAEKLDRKLQDSASILKRRKLLEVTEKTVRELELTDAGRQLVKKGPQITSEISQLTPELIVSRKWRKMKLRKFDVTVAGPEFYPAKIHPLQQVIQRAREIFLQMGFTEIRGPLVETAFWNFDALFQPQDHPAREMMDTFYLANPKGGRLPKKSVVEAVAETHENGWTTGSKGWGYKWSSAEAKRLVMRTHTTAETIKYLSEHKKAPIKVFSVDRVYRNEQVTYQNTAEFHQIEGIVVDKGLTLRDLMGTLKMFYARFGLKKVKFWPCYFPYTEPSAQATVYVPKLKRWMELCGMGMFRPEVLAPMGIKHPVLAWGGGLERIAMLQLGLDDIRLLYGNRLSWIRRTPVCR
ncbi:MAG: phenylalanine--tRNA ligase subunit alpha [Candidatus Bathyarchaeota archaeon]|nr:MAG: phenylalanine--tRNA ligase subunit alpha [Candidatus Bathyarchaeota archaeon]